MSESKKSFVTSTIAILIFQDDSSPKYMWFGLIKACNVLAG